jgi:FeS assembly SUF system regulator
MLRISRLADYGIVLALHAAKGGPDTVHTARELAGAASLPLPTVTKVLKALTRAGVLSSQRGKAGGYSLTRSPKEISVVEVITAIDGQPAMTQCTEDPANPCEREEFCPARSKWHIVHATILRALRGLTLADMSAHGDRAERHQRPRQLVGLIEESTG